MKVSSSTVAKATATSTKFSNHILPLIEIKDDDEDSRECVRFKLRSDPAVATSPQYAFDLKILDNNSTLRQAITYNKDVQLVCAGLNVHQDPEGSLAIINRTTKGEVQNTVNNHVKTQQGVTWRNARVAAINLLPKAREVIYRPAHPRIAEQPEVPFARAVMNADGVSIDTPEQPYVAPRVAIDAVLERLAVPEQPTPEQVKLCSDVVPEPPLEMAWVTSAVNAIVTMIAPTKALALAKRQLRREVRKPSNMSIRQFVNRIRTINDVEMKRLPPFEQSLERDEILEILYHAVPASWRSEMERQGYDYSTSSATNFIIFCERLEQAATHESNFIKVQGSAKKPAGKQKPNNYTKKDSKSEFYCKIHGADSGHNTDKCYTLQNMLDKQNGDGKFKNKTWKKESNSIQKKGKGKAHKAAVQKEINMLIKKGVLKKNPKKNAKGGKASKKRKNDSSDEDSDTDESINMMDQIDLSEFKYDDMDNLKIESDDDSMSYVSASSK